MSLLKSVIEEKAQELVMEDKWADEAGKRQAARRAFGTMDSVLNGLEKLAERLDNKKLKVDMDTLGMVHERESIAKDIRAAINEFQDFMLGLEQEKDGE